jgi:tripartite ATP-independent transporter DctP family solute receptor
MVREFLPDIPRLEEFAHSIATSAEEVRKASESIAATAQEQTTLMAALAEAAGTLADESRATVGRLESTRTEALAAGTDLSASVRIVEDLLTSVLKLAELSEGTAAAMDDFGRLMGEIGTMTEFVEDVSDETQLLALNAAIEAARAGTHGLGFAVVAGEVGRLAKTTGESTNAIKELVGQIQRQAEVTIRTVRESATRSAESAPVARAAADTLSKVATLAADVGGALNHAVGVGREHADKAGGIKTQTEQIAEIASEQGRQALEAAFSTQRLAYYGAEMMYFSRPAFTRSDDHTVLRVATQLPPGYPPTQAWARFVQRVEQLSNGRVTVELQAPFAGTELEALMQVRSGELDFVSVTTYIASSLLPLAQIFDLPFLFATAHDAHAVLDGGLGKRVLESFYSFGLTGMAYFENGIRHFTNSVRPIAAPSDMKGMRVRIQDSVVYLALMHALGAAPKVLPFGEVYRALKNGDVDAQENPLFNMLGTKIYEVQRYLTLSAHTYNTQIVLGNTDSLERLSEADRAIVDKAFAEVIPYHRELAAQEDLHALTELRKHMEVTELTPAQRNDFVRAAYFVWERMGPIFPDQVYDLLLGGDLVNYEHHESREERRTSRRRFALADIVDAIDHAVGAVRTSATEAARQSRAQSPKLRDLGGVSGDMSTATQNLAVTFTDLLSRFASAQDDVAATRDTVRELAGAVQELAAMAMDSRNALEQFGALMKQISDIIALVRSVSDRTNLLALNAAIEAARAGDYGKGFAVVAGEVRSLADKTRASTQQMRGVLVDLDSRGKSAQVAIGGGVEQAERSAKQAAAAESALIRIDAFTTAVIDTLAAAQREATSEAHRAFAMKGDFEEMSVLIEHGSEESLRSVDSTIELERQRQALFNS